MIGVTGYPGACDFLRDPERCCKADGYWVHHFLMMVAMVVDEHGDDYCWSWQC